MFFESILRAIVSAFMLLAGVWLCVKPEQIAPWYLGKSAQGQRKFGRAFGGLLIFMSLVIVVGLERC